VRPFTVPDGIHFDADGHRADRTLLAERLMVGCRRDVPLRIDRLSFSLFDPVHYPYETDPAAFDFARAVYDEHGGGTEAERLGFDAVF
jgi:hypothetical protein